MGTKAYLMVKVKRTNGVDRQKGAVKDLELMPEVESVVPVSGEYDLIVVAAVDAPARVGKIAQKIESRDWLQSLHVLKVEPAEPNPFLDEVCSLPGGECVRWCMQCGMCSASCPNVSEMDYSPRKLIALIRAGRRYDVLTSNTMWICASCYLCTARCPKDVKITDLMHSLERLASQHGLPTGKVSTPVMYRAFVESIRNNGRVFEMGMMVRFYLATLPTWSYMWAVITRKANPFEVIGMLPLMLKFLLHGRLSIRPRKIKGIEQIRAMLEKAQALGGER